MCGHEDRGEIRLDTELVDHLTDRVANRGRGLGMLRDRC
jgi:hypothetical protein